MKFYDRETELKILTKYREMSKNGSVFTVVTGRRRIGKTKLILESVKSDPVLYLYVPRSNEAILCEQLAKNAKRDLGITLFDTGRFRDLFEQVMKYGREKNFTFVIDEFQELERINGSIMSSIQELWDMNKDESKVNLIVCGSVYSLMIKIFERNKEPLFGRASSKFNIKPFKPSVIKTILKDHNPNYRPDDLLFLYMVTGGVPKYIQILMDSGATSFEKMADEICTPNSLFLLDGKDLLISEFGKDYGTYFSILQMIANGKNTLREINESTGKDSGPYLDNMEKDYYLVRKSRPIFSKDGSRDVRWQISDKYLQFYFRFISGNQSLIESDKNDVLKEIIISEYPQYSGHVLEDYFKEKITEEERLTGIGSYWDRKGQNEIDIIAVNDMDMKAVVAEVKRDPKRANVEKLREKSKQVYELKDYDIEFRVLSLKDM